MYPNDFRYGLLKEPLRPVDGVIHLPDKPGLGVELVDDPEKRFPFVPGPSIFANPHFPHAWERARAREESVRRRYTNTPSSFGAL
jgi:hypothetical protein